MNDKESDEAQIRALIDERIQATRERDAAGAAAHLAPNVVLFDVINPLRHLGAESAARRAHEWFASFDGPIEFDVAHLEVIVGDGVAFSYGLNHVRGTTKSSGVLDMWWRCTTGYQKIDGIWTVVHEHNSAPFDHATGRASLDLQP